MLPVLASILLSMVEPAKVVTDVAPVGGDFTYQVTFRHDGYFKDPGDGWGTGMVACYRSGYYDGWRVYVHGPLEKIVFQVGVPEGANESTMIESPNPVPHGEWHRLAFTWRGDGSGTGTLRMHVDGEFAGAKRHVPRPLVKDGEKLVIGDAGYGIGALKLEIASQSYDKRALSDAEIARAFKADKECATTHKKGPTQLQKQVLGRAMQSVRAARKIPTKPAGSGGTRERVSGCVEHQIGEFKPAGKGVVALEVALPADLEGVMLYGRVGGKVRKLPCARWPKGDAVYAETEAVYANGTFRFTDPAAPSVTPGGRMLCHGYWRYFWQDQTIPVESLGGGEFKPQYEHYYGFAGKAVAAMLNAREALTAPGEWCYIDGRLLLRPPSGLTAVLVPNHPEPLEAVKGRKNVVIKNRDFSDTLGKGLEVLDCEGVEIVNCTFRRIGGVALSIANCRDVVVRDCIFDDTGYSQLELRCGDRASLNGGNACIERCEFSRSGRLRRTYTPGIYFEGCGAVVRNCKFHDMPSSAMRIEGNDVVVMDCRFERTVCESDDQGTIDMWGNPTYRNCVFFGNYFGPVGGEGHTATGRAGVRFDDMISGMAVISNKFDNCAVGHFGAVQIHGGNYNVVVGNDFRHVDRTVTITRWSPAKQAEQFDSPDVRRRMLGYESSPLYLDRYPELSRFRTDHCLQYISNNTFAE